MTLTDDEWSRNLSADDDDDGLSYPRPPAYAGASVAESDCSAVDGDAGESIVDDGRDGPSADATGGQGFDGYRDPDDDHPAAGPGDYLVDDDDVDFLVYPLHSLNRRVARRFDGRVAMGFAAAGLVAVVVAIVGAVALYSSDGATRPGASADADAVALPPPRTTAPGPVPPTLDRPVAYTADARGSCAEGSTAAQTMAGGDPHAAFVCVRGGGDGQVVDIELPGTHLITAICVEPGWVGADASGTKPWDQYRVLTTVQYTFNDTEGTLVTQQTENVHGEACQPIKRVVASRIRMLIRETSRPPAQPQGGATTTAGRPNGPLGLDIPQLPGAGIGEQHNSDPVDAAFAVKSLKVIGHKPV